MGIRSIRQGESYFDRFARTRDGGFGTATDSVSATGGTNYTSGVYISLLLISNSQILSVVGLLSISLIGGGNGGQNDGAGGGGAGGIDTGDKHLPVSGGEFTIRVSHALAMAVLFTQQQESRISSRSIRIDHNRR